MEFWKRIFEGFPGITGQQQLFLTKLGVGCEQSRSLTNIDLPGQGESLIITRALVVEQGGKCRN